MEGRADQWRAAVLINGGPPYDQWRAAVRSMEGRRAINGGPPYNQCKAAVGSMKGRIDQWSDRTDQWRAAVLINGGPY